MRHLVRQHAGRALDGQPWRLPLHCSISDIPADIQEGRLLFGTIRDPWSWYYSWYIQAKGVAWSKDRLAEYGQGDDSFRAVLYGATHPRDIPGVRERPGLFWGPRVIDDSFADGTVGLYSWSAKKVYEDLSDVQVLVDMAQMHEGLEELTDRVELVAPPTNRGNYTWRPMSEIYLDDDMVRWVADADKALIERIGYSVPGDRAPQPLIWLSNASTS